MSAKQASKSHENIAFCHPKPSPVASGMLRPEPRAAKTDMEVEYAPVIIPTFVGNLVFTRLGNSTFNNAIPTPTNAVPINKVVKNEAKRMRIPLINNNKPAKTISSLPNRLPSFGAMLEKSAKESNGSVVRKPAILLEICRSSLIKPISGPTVVIAGRKLKATIIIPIIRSVLAIFVECCKDCL